MLTKLAYSIALGIFIAFLISGLTLAFWMLTCTKDAAEVRATASPMAILLVFGLVGTLMSGHRLFFYRPSFRFYSGE